MVRSHYAEELTPALMQPGIDASAKYNSFTTFPASELLVPARRVESAGRATRSH